MSRERAAAMIERQGKDCADLGSPLYGALLGRVAEDVRAGGPCADAVAGYEDAPRDDVVALRLLGGVHALVLSGRAPGLAAYYPSAGGSFDPNRPGACWPAFREAVAAELDWVRDWMTRPPQTNEVGRANLLIAGLLAIARTVRLPVRLFELGASAGLNLRADRFRCIDGDFSWGPADSSVVLEETWGGAPPGWLVESAREHPDIEIVERRGCDLTPLDPASPGGALALRAYLWPDQSDRAARLEGALRLASRVPATVEAIGAADFLAGVRPVPGTLTVVWHSIMRQYVPAAEWARVEHELDRLAAEGTQDAGFAHLSFEPCPAGGPRFQLAVRLGASQERVLAGAHPHGLPARPVTA
ncbi:hypothetical protein GCM10010156_76310 [Planobispora rosea]|uniref:DUF2332 domain-containing protein n=1 Tax=Planobispora rosea TaxID=35762 RepID=A0A8J3WBP4_PLARO|nr:DUF2332 domain-containing protein [Planobispora rosea]GGT07914.1 hypothetical protein GCM10010156_76310 [Planobispora rosea]GIH84124.1 hypothetical protein Pro02_25320 [Planobispora rosea]